MNEQPGLLRRVWDTVRQPSVPAARAADHVVELCDALLSERGEVSSARIASEAIAAYRDLNDSGRGAFFSKLAERFPADPVDVDRAIDAYRTDPSPARAADLHLASEPRRQELFRRLNTAAGGTATLVQMRADLLTTLQEHPDRAAIDADLVHLFRSWFNRGFLTLQRIDWRTSALILERLIQYEAVHQIQDWNDLHRRLEADRRCYAFFHPSLPDEPLIFIEAALTRGLASAVQPLIDVDAPIADPARADSAIFYSITNCQAGLRGVSFGNFLIKQAVEDLRREFPRIRTFATLSPLPGFTAWLRSSPAGVRIPEDIRAAAARGAPAEGQQRALLTLAAYYLLHARQGALPLDRVARFHLANGARIERLNWMGDSSEHGLQQSLGITVNYVYRLADVERHHEAYARRGAIAASHELHALAAAARRRP